MARAKVVSYYNNRYKGSLTEGVCDILDILHETSVVPDLRHCIVELSESDAYSVIESMDEYGHYPIGINKPLGTLEDMQTVGVAYMYWAERCLLGDSVGLGKTIQVAGLYNLLKCEYEKKGKPFRCLFLTEKALVSETRLKLVRFTGEYWDELYGEKRFCQKYVNKRYYGTDYSVVGTHSLASQDLFLNWVYEQDEFPFDLIVFDESSPLGNSTNKIYKDAKSLFQYAKRVVLLNATPFESKLDYVFNQLNILDETYLPTKSNFQAEYVIMDYRNGYGRPSGRYKNHKKFRQLVGYRYFARTREENGAVMEDCDARIVVSELTKVQKRLLSETFMKQLVYDCPTYFDSTIEFNIENVPKLESLSELLKTECADAPSVLIYVHYTDTQFHLVKWLRENGYSTELLNGEVNKNIKERNRIIRSFKNQEFKILVTNVQKGLDFGSCDYCIFYGFNPNPQKMVQFEGRITRSFDIIGKNVYLLCSDGDELKNLRKVSQRAEASANFTKRDLSCILSLLIGGSE